MCVCARALAHTHTVPVGELESRLLLISQGGQGRAPVLCDLAEGRLSRPRSTWTWRLTGGGVWGSFGGREGKVVVVVVLEVVGESLVHPSQPPASPKTKAPDGRKATNLPHPLPFTPPPSTFVWRSVLCLRKRETPERINSLHSSLFCVKQPNLRPDPSTTLAPPRCPLLSTSLGFSALLSLLLWLLPRGWCWGGSE